MSLLAYSKTPDQNYSIIDNIALELRHDGAPEGIELQQISDGVALVTAGADELIEFCIAHPEVWNEDNISGRLLHPDRRHSTSLRSRRNPSEHIVKFREADGLWRTEIHFDHCGTHNLDSDVCHFALQFAGRKADQDKIHEDLETAFKREDAAKFFITRYQRRHLYLRQTFTTAPILESFSVSAFRHYLHNTMWQREAHYEQLVERFPRTLLNRSAGNTAEYLVATWRNEDTRFLPSGQHGIKRLGSTLLSTLIVPTPNGQEISLARLANIGAKTAMNTAWNEMQGHPTHIGSQLGFNFAALAERRLWAEYGPELKKLHHRFRK